MEHELQVVNIRLVREPGLYSEKCLTCPEDAVELMAGELAQYDREVFCILNLKTNGQVINMNIVSVGTLSSALVSPREVFKSSILSNAHNVIALHNHPSSRIDPSEEDLKITERLRACGELLDIPLLDHIIVGGQTGRRFSFKEEGLLESGKPPWERQLPGRQKSRDGWEAAR